MANEKRLIDANALLEKIQYRLPFKDRVAEMINEIVEITRKQIADAPTVDAEPVVHARWRCVGQVCVDGEYVDVYRCGKCSIPHDTTTRYCPSRGAKMDGGNEDG